ncbi:hypothetical protein DFP73DRAFT_567185 [Morchella snyderi]|nr:hypothetical protein DFP73DRAFT_567185 [Morchella snyderi]
MDQRAAEIVRLSRERRRLKGAVEGLGKENERLVPDMERLSLKYDEAVEKCPGKVEEWYHPLRLRENETWEEFDKVRAKWVTVRIEMQKAREDLDRTELERERLIMGLATVLSEKVKVESEARGSVVETGWLRVEADWLAAEMVRLKVEVEAREAVVETERLRVEAEKLAAEVVRLKAEAESERAARD